ncbi:radical SAM family heme chaperone HemW [Flavobacterium selenitireducens]|uniref:radical SAM family heme chaperone HemW n=1 Tax=Flavobacterium selenitireducens TaxID=2722704 RepID=UPI00168BA7F2|nr:radical SAM family heme chaperone HemW [Flavobacterium selenitireducens]MBD3582022.1 radical SAM family heme chaperone HemW [Flavobacterium selenitireducens]
MSGLYLHIPFCKQACHYCDFHFSTNFKKKDEMVAALAKELVLRKDELVGEKVETIYFGGGTPSVLSAEEINSLIDSVYANYDVSEDPEITLEANPDDLSSEKISELSASGINRLSIGIQSFYDADLAMMNRAHDSAEAKKSLADARKYFDNITIDLIYGIPGMSDDKWKSNIDLALSYDVPHISAYALTVEPKTALRKMIAEGKVGVPKDDVAESHFRILTEILGRSGFVHYELSNFGKPEYFSRNNSAYWLGKHYLGIGPSAHSFDGKSRSWNVANNALYIKQINSGELPSEVESLTKDDRYNEYVMTGLRTIWGVSLSKIESDFGSKYVDHLLGQAQKFFDTGLLEISENTLKATQKGKFLTDGIASDLFVA